MASSGAGAVVGLSAVVLGGWLVDCAVQNRPPLRTLVTVLQNPSNRATILSQTKGTLYPVPKQAQA
jgi:hypothetical protein